MRNALIPWLVAVMAFWLIGLQYPLINNALAAILIGYFIFTKFSPDRKLLPGPTDAYADAELMKTIYDHIPCEITLISPDYRLLAMNREVVRVTGVKAEEAVGKQCYEVFGDGSICPDCPVKKAIDTKTIQENKKEQYTLNHSVVYIHQLEVPILADNGAVRYVVEMSLDISAEVELQDKNHRIFIETVGSLAKLIGSRDHYTGDHSARVAEIAVAIAKEMGLPKKLLAEISVAAILHDIGKIGIPENILNKTGKLTAEEFTIIKTHSRIGYDALVAIESLQKTARYILHHHERWDGSGYPSGLQGKQIPLISRIISVADVFEALTADRVYRPALPREQALTIISRASGQTLDPLVVRAFERGLNRRLPPAG